MPSQSSVERFIVVPIGSRHSSNGSSKPDNYSNVEELLLKAVLKESR